MLLGIIARQARALPDLCPQLPNTPVHHDTRLLAHPGVTLKPAVRAGSCPALLLGMPKLPGTVFQETLTPAPAMELALCWGEGTEQPCAAPVTGTTFPQLLSSGVFLSFNF